MALLLDRGADPRATDRWGTSILFEPTRKGDLPAMTLLLDRGADPRREGEAALHWAAENGHVAAMALLLDRGADLSAVDSFGSTALHACALNGHVDAVTLLLDRGVDLSVTNEWSETALDVAVLNHHGYVTAAINVFVNNVSGEWRASRHRLYPLPFRSAVATVLALWSWNPTTRALWHTESPFPLLSLELLYEVFIWLAADIASRGYVMARAPLAVDKSETGRGRFRSEEEEEAWNLFN